MLPEAVHIIDLVVWGFVVFVILLRVRIERQLDMTAMCCLPTHGCDTCLEACRRDRVSAQVAADHPSSLRLMALCLLPDPLQQFATNQSCCSCTPDLAV